MILITQFFCLESSITGKSEQKETDSMCKFARAEDKLKKLCHVVFLVRIVVLLYSS